jgi:hypothetical protein
MAQIIIEVNNNVATDVRDTLCAPNGPWGYTGSQADNNAKMAFLKQYIAAWIKTEYQTSKSNIDAKAATIASLISTSTADIS